MAGLHWPHTTLWLHLASFSLFSFFLSLFHLSCCHGRRQQLKQCSFSLLKPDRSGLWEWERICAALFTPASVTRQHSNTFWLPLPSSSWEQYKFSTFTHCNIVPNLLCPKKHFMGFMKVCEKCDSHSKSNTPVMRNKCKKSYFDSLIMNFQATHFCRAIRQAPPLYFPPGVMTWLHTTDPWPLWAQEEMTQRRRPLHNVQSTSLLQNYLRESERARFLRWWLVCVTETRVVPC